ncbi:MAG: ABC transporter substrate-binding protein [Proteobacteria bacterium]|nr:ABC transporter substrate-binding protein [Pseudomonadota bacterium]MBU1388350.1 ABC transporter substrate-binding protein [Pseudomonadota bacterium]MBU1542826.1 ABC transporter substrate-binding protein [Pseudomonadota bacterium]MBU2430835.1 ABC transporter substrate-binding protein [Pseudomonadota bacterium]MBU2482945.1 ABC transporter substrate-binding protein [Pseudomonadota bacterium]
MHDYNPEKMKLLLVEDQASMRKIEIKILKEIGFTRIVEAEDGNVAIDLLQDTDDIDLIISDWNMPNKGGDELLVWVRAYKKYKHIPFIMATAQADREQLQKARKDGVSGFISKPFTAEELKKTIDDVLGAAREEDESVSHGPIMGRSGKVKLRVAHIQITDHLILGVLKDKIAKGEMSPKYFELETRCMASWNPVEQALDKGMVDAAFILAPIAQDLFVHGVPIRLTLLAHKNGSAFVRNRKGGYAEPCADFFKGKSFLIPHKLSVHHMLAHMFFEKKGLNASLEKGNDIHVNFEVVAPVNMPEFLRASQSVGGFMVAEPIASKSIAAGICDMQFLSGELWENHPCCVVAVRDDFAGLHTDAVYEFTQLLVDAGKYISDNIEDAARIGVGFLDPEGMLGLTAPVLSNVLSASNGITTKDLFPKIQDFDRMQRYMHDVMGIGSLVDIEKFIDLRYAQVACQDMHVCAGNFCNRKAELDALLVPVAASSGFKLIVEDGYVKIYRNSI